MEDLVALRDGERKARFWRIFIIVHILFFVAVHLPLSVVDDLVVVGVSIEVLGIARGHHVFFLLGHTRKKDLKGKLRRQGLEALDKFAIIGHERLLGKPCPVDVVLVVMAKPLAELARPLYAVYPLLPVPDPHAQGIAYQRDRSFLVKVVKGVCEVLLEAVAIAALSMPIGLAAEPWRDMTAVNGAMAQLDLS